MQDGQLDNEHFRKLENVYRCAPINRLYQPTIEVGMGVATITYAVQPGMFHAADALHGSAYFKGLDDAAFFAVNSLFKEVFVLTATFNIYLLRPVTQGRLRAEGRVTNQSRRLCVAESILFLEPDRPVARGSGTFMPSQTRLREIDSYSL